VKAVPVVVPAPLAIGVVIVGDVFPTSPPVPDGVLDKSVATPVPSDDKPVPPELIAIGVVKLLIPEIV